MHPLIGISQRRAKIGWDRRPFRIRTSYRFATSSALAPSGIPASCLVIAGIVDLV
jgi:hypothetical protein